MCKLCGGEGVGCKVSPVNISPHTIEFRRVVVEYIGEPPCSVVMKRYSVSTSTQGVHIADHYILKALFSRYRKTLSPSVKSKAYNDNYIRTHKYGIVKQQHGYTGDTRYRLCMYAGRSCPAGYFKTFQEVVAYKMEMMLKHNQMKALENFKNTILKEGIVDI